MPIYSTPIFPTTWQGSDYGYISMSYDVALSTNTSTPLTPAGTPFGIKIPIRRRCLVTNVVIHLTTAGSGLTANQCGAALYQNNVLLSATAMTMSTVWNSLGTKVMALTTPQDVAAGFVDVVLFYNGTTGPALLRSGATAGNLALTTTALRNFTTNDTGRTTTFPATLGTRTASAVAYWAAVS
jgi:hypothetical protein